jgi:hypothetical protein
LGSIAAQTIVEALACVGLDWARPSSSST